MTDAFYNLYKTASQKTFDFAGIIGTYQGLISMTIDNLESEYPLYSKEQLIEKLKLYHEQLKQKFQEANT